MIQIIRRGLAIVLPFWLAADTPAAAQASAHAASEPAILQIRVLEGQGAVYAANSRAPRALVVQITDETGQPVENATVIFRLPEDGSSGVFNTGLKSEVVGAGPDGRASAGGVRWNGVPGSVQIGVIAIKGRARAGVAVNVSLFAPGAEAAGVAVARKESRGGRKKWVALGLLLAAGAGAGAAVALRTSKAPSAPPAPPQIGAPTIVIGRP